MKTGVIRSYNCYTNASSVAKLKVLIAANAQCVNHIDRAWVWWALNKDTTLRDGVENLRFFLLKKSKILNLCVVFFLKFHVIFLEIGLLFSWIASVVNLTRSKVFWCWQGPELSEGVSVDDCLGQIGMWQYLYDNFRF